MNKTNAVIRKIAELFLVDHLATELEEIGLGKQIHGELTVTIPAFVNAKYSAGNWDSLIEKVLPELSVLTVCPAALNAGAEKFGEDSVAWELWNKLSGNGGAEGDGATDFVDANFDFYEPDVGCDVAMMIAGSIQERNS